MAYPTSEPLLDIVYGKITYATGVPSVTSNDGSMSVADTGTGNPTLTFNAFNAVPTVLCSVVKGTHSATTHNNVEAGTPSATSVDFHFLEHVNGSANSSPDPADDEEIHFSIIGHRNR